MFYFINLINYKLRDKTFIQNSYMCVWHCIQGSGDKFNIFFAVRRRASKNMKNTET